MKDRYSKLAFLHRVKERKTPSLSAQASFAPFSLKVAWSGKSLIGNFSLVSHVIPITISTFGYTIEMQGTEYVIKGYTAADRI